MPILLALGAFGQEREVFYDYNEAFKHPNSVRVIDINCMHTYGQGPVECDSIPPSIDTFQNLTALYLSETNIKSIPNSINKLSRLKRISFNYSYQLDHETELCKLVGLDSLEFLGLSMSNIEILPDCIGHLTSLKDIDVSQNNELNTKQAFSIFKNLPHLEVIDLGGVDNLKVIPIDILELKNLISLKLDYLERDFDYKTSLSRMSSLEIESLTFANSWLESLPNELSQVKSLKYIDLSENDFDSIPTQVFQLTNLKHIVFHSNNRTFIKPGKGITKLQKLEKINLAGNWQLDGSSTIKVLSTLPNLKDVNLNSCRLDTIPEEIRNFKSLEKLDLAFNPEINFADLFMKLSSLQTIKNLDLADNKLTTLPKEIGLLTSLESLSLGLNPIEKLPEEFYALKKLKVLYVYGNYDSKLNESEIEKIKKQLPECKIIKEWRFRN